MATVNVVRVGVGVIIRDPRNPRKVFAGMRRNSHGDGTLALPGGHLEMHETWEECAIRETLEETGLKIDSVRFGHVTNDSMREERKHYVTIFMMGECVCPDTRPQNLEPLKCDGWESFSWEELCQFAARSNASSTDSNESGAEIEENDGSPILFGPLLKLVEEAPQIVLDFLDKSP
eukprot:CAMPEP_0172331204 /NCGR_PEP_ID=MMETSP1058-20130122/61808_1 /TAXON_ID=83371 /ORGANISM="Detonula confervacea, Strain CCMP 353" /LENGTH=175 /DNA_ID=CAMNT_0013048463 /DNA_START=95 /DNA_END=622 /DNA_ORIENTATION=+